MNKEEYLKRKNEIIKESEEELKKLKELYIEQSVEEYRQGLYVAWKVYLDDLGNCKEEFIKIYQLDEVDCFDCLGQILSMKPNKNTSILIGYKKSKRNTPIAYIKTGENFPEETIYLDPVINMVFGVDIKKIQNIITQESDEDGNDILVSQKLVNVRKYLKERGVKPIVKKYDTERIYY